MTLVLEVLTQILLALNLIPSFCSSLITKFPTSAIFEPLANPVESSAKWKLDNKLDL